MSPPVTINNHRTMMNGLAEVIRARESEGGRIKKESEERAHNQSMNFYELRKKTHEIDSSHRTNNSKNKAFNILNYLANFWQ